MPALHIHDVARIAYNTLSNGIATWTTADEERRERWRVAIQQIADDEPFALEDLSEDRTGIIIDFVEACRPYFEPEP